MSIHVFAVADGLHGGALENVYWGVLVVTYPFISGLVAGSFVVASLSHVFKIHHFDKLAPLALIVSFALLLAAPITVLADSRQPVNAFELFTRPHIPWSPLGDFVAIWLSYVVLMVVETYVVFRLENARRALGTGWRARLSNIVALGSKDLGEESRKRDAKLLMFLSSIGIALAFLFHGYIGFVFGAIKARAIWSTPLMPVLFIVSAMLSGVALMYLIYTAACRFYKQKHDAKITCGLLVYLMAFLVLDAFLDILDLVTSGVSAYTQGPVSQGVSSVFIHGPHALSYLGLQLGVGIILPIVLWTFRSVRQSILGGAVISTAVVIGVYSMRYNVVLGGQMESKISDSVVHMSIPFMGFDSVQTVIGIFAIAFLLFLFFSWLFPWCETAANADTYIAPEQGGAPTLAANPVTDEQHIATQIADGVGIEGAKS